MYEEIPRRLSKLGIIHVGSDADSRNDRAGTGAGTGDGDTGTRSERVFDLGEVPELQELGADPGVEVVGGLLGQAR